MFACHRVASALVWTVGLFTASLADARASTGAKAAPSKQVDLTKLPNEELVKKADAIYTRGIKPTDHGVRDSVRISDHLPLWLDGEIAM